VKIAGASGPWGISRHEGSVMMKDASAWPAPGVPNRDAIFSSGRTGHCGALADHASKRPFTFTWVGCAGSNLPQCGHPSNTMQNFKNKVAAITGAASGMGRTLALELAGRGCHLALSDVNEKGLAETAQMAGKLGVKVTTAKLDVANREAVYAWADQVVADHGKVNLIFNNAGVALGAFAETVAPKDFEWIMGINFWGVVW